MANKTKAVVHAKLKDVNYVKDILTSYKAEVLEEYMSETWMYRDEKEVKETLYLYTFIVMFPSKASMMRFRKEHCPGTSWKSSIFRRNNERFYDTPYWMCFKS